MIVIGLAMGRSTVVEFKGSHFEREIVLWGVCWYVAYPVSYRQLEEMMEERGVDVDHSSLNRWVLEYVPLLDKAFRARKRRVGDSWRMDETYVRIRGQWKYLYRAVDKAGNTVDFLLTAKRDGKAALRFLYKAIGQHGAPAKITIDKSTANTAAIENYNSEHDTKIELRQVKYLNNIVEQDHRAIKRKVRPMMGFKSFWSASVTLAGIELMHMIPQRPVEGHGTIASGAAVLFAGQLTFMAGTGLLRCRAEFAREPDELRNLLRSRSHMRQHVPAATRSFHHMRRTAIALGILQAA
jgi:putative transposase